MAPEILEIKTGDKTIRGYYDPNYKHKCETCGQVPCVRIRKEDGSMFYDGDMCGACTWGEANAIDPANW